MLGGQLFVDYLKGLPSALMFSSLGKRCHHFLTETFGVLWFFEGADQVTRESLLSKGDGFDDPCYVLAICA